LLDELRYEYEVVCTAAASVEVENLESIDARLRNTFGWLEQAITYPNPIKPPIAHRFDLGYGYAFDSPRFSRGTVTRQQRRTRGLPVPTSADSIA